MTEPEKERIRTVAIAVFSSLRAECAAPRDAIAALLLALGMCSEASQGVTEQGVTPVAWDDADFLNAARALYEDGQRAMRIARGLESAV